MQGSSESPGDFKQLGKHRGYGQQNVPVDSNDECPHQGNAAAKQRIAGKLSHYTKTLIQ
jgi:hypothetical protein